MSDARDEDGLALVVWGARGSIPSSPDDPTEFGMHTSCVEIQAGARRLVFDAGSGILGLGKEIAAGPDGRIELFLTHAHYDHIMGLPYFAPLHYARFSVRIHAGHMTDGRSCEDVVGAYMSAPFHPVSPKVFCAETHYRTFRPGDAIDLGDGLHIATHRLNHPNGAVAYRVEHGGRAIVYATDTEHEPGTPDLGLRRFAEGADILVYDTNFVDAEMELYRGYGHSSVEEGIRICRDASIGRLVLFHHSFKRPDAELRRIEADARAAFPGAVAARPGLRIALPSHAAPPSQSAPTKRVPAAVE